MIQTLSFRLPAVLSLVVLLGACAQTAKQPDYTALRKSKPSSILVLPPVNDTTDVAATYGMLSQMTRPLAESGYYVIPVAVMDETFRQNGLTQAAEIEGVPAAKLREIFGADAALYSKLTRYGSVYQIVDSTTVVAASARLVDLRTGDVLWQGEASATGTEAGGSRMSLDGMGIVGLLAQGVTRQVVHSLTDEAHDVAGLTSRRLLSAGQPNGLLYGPRSTKYGTDD
ncbi:MAG: putative lipoprotein [Burkholderia plantarii]|nr:MAG: putative lipoprotein [Burkholderia plantarii]